MNDIKFDWNDVTIAPSPTFTDINSRKKEVNPYKYGKMLPLIAAPMDTVIDADSYENFLNAGIEVCTPRGVDVNDDRTFKSIGIKEIEDILKLGKSPKKVLLDVANGHMKLVYDLAKSFKTKFPDSELMVGNIAHPDIFLEYENIGVDYVRCGIGGGSACTTSANTSVHYPMGSLIKECNNLRSVHTDTRLNTKIVADGGFKNYSDIIKALGMGADYVMLGSILNKTLESCSPSYDRTITGNYSQIDKITAENNFDKNLEIYKYYRGMSTKEVQRDWGKKVLTTSEGISMYNKVEYKLDGWVENLTDYLMSTMSYCGKRKLEDFIGGVDFVRITQQAFNRFNK